MTTKPRWSVALRGEAGDLRYLSTVMKDGEATITAEADGTYELKSRRFEALGNAGEVRQAAEEIAQALFGIAKLSFQAENSFEVGAVFEQNPTGPGRHTTLQVDSAVMRIRSYPATLIHTRADGTEVVDRETHILSERLRAALANEDAQKALRLLAKDGSSWVDLYRLIELVQENVPVDTLSKWISKADLKRLKHTANSVNAAGDGARHGTEGTVPPANPFRLTEARGLVHGLVERWLDLLVVAHPNQP